jgi:Cu/Ag efflux protein CusF
MKLAGTILVGLMFAASSSAASAQSTPPTQQTPPPPGTQKGLVKVVNRLNGTIAIQGTQDGTTGANAAGATEQFKIGHKLSEGVHAGDKVKFSVSEANGAKTVTKIEAE